MKASSIATSAKESDEMVPSGCLVRKGKRHRSQRWREARQLAEVLELLVWLRAARLYRMGGIAGRPRGAPVRGGGVTKVHG
jgi:hypothetical protein